MKKIIFFSFALLSLAPACKKQNNTPAQPVAPVFDSTVYGKWKWIATYNDGNISSTNPATPQNTGNNEEITFNTDGTWSETVNGSIKWSGVFTLGHSDSLLRGIFHDSVNLSGVIDPKLAVNKYYLFYHDTIDFSSAYLEGSGATLWVKE